MNSVADPFLALKSLALMSQKLGSVIVLGMPSKSLLKVHSVRFLHFSFKQNLFSFGGKITL